MSVDTAPLMSGDHDFALRNARFIHGLLERLTIMSDKNIFDEISKYWSEQINNEIYLIKENKNLRRGTKEYFDFLLEQQIKYVYYFKYALDYFGMPDNNKKLLEVGCGIGLDLVRLAKHGYECYGIDLADRHIDLAQQCFNIYNQKAVIQKGNAEKLDFQDNFFDLVYSNGVIHHTHTPQNAINEVYRVLRPKGKAFIMLYSKYSLNNFAHFITRKPYENPKGLTSVSPDAHFVYRYSRSDIINMCKKFSKINLNKEYIYGAGWGKIYDLTPKFIYYPLSKLLGWHWIIYLVK